MRIVALESTLSSSTVRIGELESPLALETWKFDTSAAKLESTERRLRFAKDVTSLMQEQVQSQGPHLCEVDAAHVAAEVVGVAAEPIFQSLSMSTSSLRREAAPLTWRVRELFD